jgi:sulfatase maturation enzyme AslB (radical SAM superfamily)
MRNHKSAMQKHTPDTFCVIPWLHRMTDEQGFHKLCCIAVGEGNSLRNAKGERLHISQKLTDEQVLNSPTAKEVRLQMMRGEWPEVCERCRQREEVSGKSIRHQLNVRFEHGNREELLSQTRADGTLDRPVVRYADIRLGNVCNLTCRMCVPDASRLWAASYNKVQPKSWRRPKAELKALGRNNWVKHESVAWLIEQCLPTAESFNFAGGEPLIIPEMVEALELCVRSGRAGEISLSYNTNLTVLPEKVTSLWPHFHHVSLVCSVDGFGRVNDYIRRPSKWNDIDRNLKAVDRHFEEWNIRWAGVSATVQLHNILTIHELIAYLRNAGFSRLLPLPQLVPLFYPGYLSVQGLPRQAKAVARQRLESEIERAEAGNQGYPADPADIAAFIGSIRSVIEFMDAQDTTSGLSDFLFFCRESDRAFGDSWREIAPELAQYLGTDHIK